MRGLVINLERGCQRSEQQGFDRASDRSHHCIIPDFDQDEDCNLHIFGLPMVDHLELLKPEGLGVDCITALDKAVEQATSQV